jgi:molecular chaperone GrpE (heat shock protein)
MTERVVPKPAIVPFLIGDLLLLAAAGIIVYFSAWPLQAWQVALCVASVMAGAWLLVVPFIMEHKAAIKLAETQSLTSTLVQFQTLGKIGAQIQGATTEWQHVQDEAARTTAAAKELAEGMATEAKAFTEFLQRANNMEKANLRLEVDKLRRSEGEWLQVTVRTLDHVFALHQAGVRSGQEDLIAQLGQFQATCRDAARRVGLAVFEPLPGELFNPQQHQLPDGQTQAAPDAVVAAVLACGVSFQTRLLRPAVVVLQTEPVPQPCLGGGVTSAE